VKREIIELKKKIDIDRKQLENQIKDLKRKLEFEETNKNTISNELTSNQDTIDSKLQ